jgi:hypothetical protein
MMVVNVQKKGGNPAIIATNWSVDEERDEKSNQEASVKA